MAGYIDDMGRPMTSSEYMDFKRHVKTGGRPPPLEKCPDCGSLPNQKHDTGCETLARLMTTYNQRLGPLNQLDAEVAKVCEAAR